MKLAENSGFTLVEVMVTLAVLIVVLSTGVPSFGAQVKNNRLATENHALRTVLGAARSEARAQRTTVTVCRSANAIECSAGNWGAGYIAFIDSDRDSQLDNNEVLLEHREQSAQGIGIGYSRADGILRFDSNGNAADSNGTFTFCDDRGAGEAHSLIVSIIGAVSATVAAEDAGSKPKIQHKVGDDVTCNII